MKLSHHYSIVCSIAAFCGLALSAQATNYYVSPESTSTNWAAAASAATPCTTATAFTNAVAGDTVFFRGGIYIVPPKNSGNYMTGYYNVAHSGTAGAPIVFKAYPGETPTFDGVSGGTGDIDGHDYGHRSTIFSTYYQNYIIFDGFTFQSDGGVSEARIVVTGGYNDSKTRTTGCVVTNCIINGGTDVTPSNAVPGSVGSYDIREGLFLSQTENLTISNCRIYDYKQSANSFNTSGIKAYYCRNVSVENCEIYDCTLGIYYKGDIDDSTIRYNYVHDCYSAVCAAGYGWWNDPNDYSKGYFLSESDNLSIYHNVFSFSTDGMLSVVDTDGTCSDGLTIYNNTFYTAGNQRNVGISLPGGSGQSFYNNIVQGALRDYDKGLLRWFASDNVPARVQAGVIVTLQIDSADHNQFGDSPGSFYVRVMKPDSRPYEQFATLAAWQASSVLTDGGHPGAGDLASAPRFANASGTMAALSDFALLAISPCKGTGRNGVDMGANIALVGIQPSSYAAWRTGNFTGADATNDAISGPNADPDGSGLSNYARYAFNLAARGRVAPPTTLGTVTVGQNQFLTLTFPRRETASDLSYTVESSTDLTIWTPVPGLIYTPGDGPVTAQDAVSMGAGTPRRFLRIRIAQP